MNKITLTAAALAAVLATPAFAQQSPPASTPATPPAATSPAPSGSMQNQDKGSMADDKGAASDKGASATDAKTDMKKNAADDTKSGDMKNASAAGDKKPGFVQKQNSEEWRASKLIGSSVSGPGDKSIGDINDVIVTGDGSIKAVVVGVGGFLGVGEKHVAIPFESLSVSRKADSNAIDKITVSFSTDELKNAPDFAFYETPKSQTTGSSSATSPMSRPSPMGGAGGAPGGTAK